MSKPTITAATLAAAETLFGIAYTEAERDLMLGNLAPQIEQALRRRALTLPASLGPAHRFDPRLPGYGLPKQGPFAFTPPESALPDSDDDIAFAPVARQSGWIKSRQLTSTRLTGIYLDRIARFDPRLNALCRGYGRAGAGRRGGAGRDDGTGHLARPAARHSLWAEGYF